MAQPNYPAAAASPPGGVVISKPTQGEIFESKKWKNEQPKVSYDVFRVIRDGKNIIKVCRVESRKGITDRRLVFQSINGKPVCQKMTTAELEKAGVNLKY